MFTSFEPLKVISVRAPWWYAIVHLGKDIENRGWYTDYRGPVAIHASRWWDVSTVDAHLEVARDMRASMSNPPALTTSVSRDRMRTLGGYIVGVARIIDCVQRHESPWFQGPYGLVLTDQTRVTPLPCRGRLGLFDAPQDVRQHVVTELGTDTQDDLFQAA